MAQLPLFLGGTSPQKRPKIGKVPPLTPQGGLNPNAPRPTGLPFTFGQKPPSPPRSVVFKPPTDAFDLAAAAHNFKNRLGSPFKVHPKIAKPTTPRATAPKPQTTTRPQTSPAPSTPPATTTTATAGAGKKGGAPATSGASTHTTSTTRHTGASVAAKGPNVANLFAPAKAELERQRQAVETRRLREAADLESFKKWQSDQQAKLTTSFGDAQAAAQAQAQAIRSTAIDNANAATQRALQNVNPDIAREAGLSSAIDQNAAAAQGPAAAALGASTAGQIGKDYVAGMQSSRDARIANENQAIADRAAMGNLGVDRAGNALEQKIGETKLAQFNNDRNFNLQRQAAQALNLYRQAGLKQQYKIAATRAQADALQNQIMNDIKQGNLDVAKANLIYKQNTQAWREKNANANRQLRVDLAKFTQAGKQAGKAKADTAAAAKGALGLADRVTQSLYPGVTWATANDDQIRQVVRNTIGQLRAQYPSLKQEDAVRILGSAVGANRLADFGPLIASYWRQ